MDSVCPHELECGAVATHNCSLHCTRDADKTPRSCAQMVGLLLIQDDLAPCLNTRCSQAGLGISGINAEVMPGQWEFQIGPVGPLEVGDQVCLHHLLLSTCEYSCALRSNAPPICTKLMPRATCSAWRL